MAGEFSGFQFRYPFLIGLTLIISGTTLTTSSSIPIWEFLNRNEKMSQLYSTFAQLVSVHCKLLAGSSTYSTSAVPISDSGNIRLTMPVPVNHCKHDLLSYGYERLQSFDDDQLDAFDPYQRGANELLWSSIMRNHSNSRLLTSSYILRHPWTPSHPTASLTSVINDGVAAAPQPETSSSSLILLVRPRPSPGQQPSQNPIFESTVNDKEPQQAQQQQEYAMNMDISYGYPNTDPSGDLMATPSHTFNDNSGQFSEMDQRQTAPERWKNSYLSGPLVVRVKPDGSPVEEDRFKPLPKDDDLEFFGQPSTHQSNRFRKSKDYSQKQPKPESSP